MISARRNRSRPSARTAPRIRPNFEALEDRCLPSTFPLQVLDTNPGVTGSFPSDLADLQGKLFFAANDGVHGRQLWATRGSAPSTYLVKVINDHGDSNPTDLVAVGQTVYFAADNGSNGVELWKSNGTPASTAIVKDINTGTGSSNPANLVNFNGTLFFTATDGLNGVELWKSDGTATGTVMVADINPTGDSNPTLLTVVGNQLFFRATDGVNGYELWVSDGTGPGTQLVADINPESPSGFPTVMTAYHGKVFFAASDGETGVELWKSDGTPDGTQQVADINPGSGSSTPSWLAISNDHLFFAANDGTHGNQLWRTDGGAPTIVAQINATGDANPEALTDVNGVLFFRATDGVNGIELWKSDGTTATLVKDILPGAGDSKPVNLVSFRNLLWFQANDGVHGVELWRSDGTPGGTVLVKDIHPGNGGSNAGPFTVSSGVLYFAANDGTDGRELWRLFSDIIATGPDAGRGPLVNVYDGQTGAFDYSFNAFDPSWTGGVRVAVGDVNGDGVPDIVAAAGPGSIGPDVRVFDGATGLPLEEFMAYNPGFKGGVFVAVADFNKDGHADIVTGADANGGPHVEVWSGIDNSLLASFYAYPGSFHGGVRVAAADVTGDGVPDIITAPGVGMQAKIKIFRGANLASAGPGSDIYRQWLAYDAGWYSGAYVAAGDLNGDGQAEIITGAAAGGGPHTEVWNGSDGSLLSSYYAYDPSFSGGVRVAILGDVDDDGMAEVLAGAGPGAAQNIRTFSNGGKPSLDDFFAYGGAATEGVFVGGSHQ